MNDQPKFTPGPWKRSKTANLCVLAGSKGHNKTICVMKNPHDGDFEANMDLVVVAPEMFEALEYISGNIGIVLAGHAASDDEKDFLRAMKNRADDAIAKALKGNS